MRMLTALVVGVCLHSTSTVAEARLGAAANDVSATGDWAGWIYQDGGGDLPVRFHLAFAQDAWSATYDLPHQGSERLPMAVEDADGTLALRAKGGLALVFAADFKGGATSGRVSLDGEPFGVFEAVRSPIPLASVDPASYAGLVGSYRFDSGRVVIVDRRFWGELMAFETESGRHATLFPLDDRRFFTGSAMYVPAPVTALVTFFEDELLWHEPGAEPELGTRILIEHTDVEFESDGALLSGTLVHPRGAEDLPTVVVLGGSDWTVREGLEREALIWASSGFSAFVYDKRGNGRSGGDPTVPFRTTAGDARAAARTIAELPEVDADSILVTGVSRGGWFAPLAAAGPGPFAGCITFVGPAVSPARQETTRRLNDMRRAGYSEEEVAKAHAYLEAAWRFALDGDAPRLQKAYEAAKDAPWAELVDVAGPDGDWSWVRMNMHFDPLPVFEELHVPLLAVYGEKDENVVPAENVPLLETALARGGHTDHRIVILPGVNHGLRLVDSDDQRPWSHAARGFAPGMWPLVTTWAREHVGR